MYVIYVAAIKTIVINLIIKVQRSSASCVRRKFQDTSLACLSYLKPALHSGYTQRIAVMQYATTSTSSGGSRVGIFSN